MIKGGLLAIIFSWSAAAATINADSVSRTDVAAAITAASVGDTVQVPAGHAQWATGITITDKPLTIRFGTATNDCHVVNTSGGENTWLFTISGTSATGLTWIWGLNAYGTNNGAGNAQGSGVLVTANSKSVRISHSTFSNMRRHGVQFVGAERYGLVDHSAFTNCYTAIEANGGNNSSWGFTDAASYSIGTTNCVTVEDCYFENNDDSGVTDLNNTIYVSNGGRMDMRNCVAAGKGTEQNFIFWDSHGNNTQEPFTGSPLRGTVWASISNLVLSADSSYRHFYLRGGMHALVKIIATGPAGAAVVSLTEEEAWADFSFATILTVWPAPDQITNSWVSEFTYNGAALTQTRIETEFGDVNAVTPGYDDNDDTFIQHGRDFFMTNLVANIPAFGTDHPTISGGFYGVAWQPYPHAMVTALDGSGSGSSTRGNAHGHSANVGTVRSP